MNIKDVIGFILFISIISLTLNTLMCKLYTDYDRIKMTFHKSIIMLYWVNKSDLKPNGIIYYNIRRFSLAIFVITFIAQVILSDH